MRYFLDTEFHERPNTIELISVGIYREDGKSFYAESLDYRDEDASDWLKVNVIPHLWKNKMGVAAEWRRHPEVTGGLFRRKIIGEQIVKWIGDDTPEFWGYYADYDWVVFCWLFGAMVDLPKGWPMYCRDIKQLCDQMGNPELPKQVSTEHHALADARWNLTALSSLEAMAV